MTKVKSSLIKFSGRRGDDIYVNSKRYPPYVRRAVTPGTKREEPVLKMQYTRTKYLNQLASELNKIIQRNSDDVRPTTFYQELQKRFRKEPLNNRYLLLLQLRGMEVNPSYPLDKLGIPAVSVLLLKNKLIINLKVKRHPTAGKHKADCYEYEVLMVTWGREVNDEVQLSEWVDMKSKAPEFDFEFERKVDTKHWLACIRLRLGIKGEPIDTLASTGMQIIEAGTFVKKDLEILKEREDEKRRMKSIKVEKYKAEEVKRVKAKKVV